MPLGVRRVHTFDTSGKRVHEKPFREHIRHGLFRRNQPAAVSDCANCQNRSAAAGAEVSAHHTTGPSVALHTANTVSLEQQFDTSSLRLSLYSDTLVRVTWTAALLNDVILDLRARRGDTAGVEVKAAALGCPYLGETLSAFGNMPDGGTLILGVDEATGFAITGLGDVSAIEQGVAAQARTSVTPPVQCSFDSIEISGATVLVCEVSPLPLESRPATHHGKAYLRQSDGDYELGAQELAQLELLKTQARRPTHPDRAPVPGTGVDALDSGLVSSFIQAVRASTHRHSQVDDDEVLRRQGVLAEDGSATVAGLYALGAYPQQHLRHLSITAAVRPPRSAGFRTHDLVHLDGPLPELLDEAMSWIRRNTRTSMGYDERGHGRDFDELPMLAVREIVANALVHRNLDAITENKGIDIRLLEDRLVVTNPGGLWGVSERQLGQPGARSAVNSTLYEICKYVRLPDGSRVIEGEGGGIREARLAIREAGLRPPTFVDTSLRFTVLMSRHTLLTDDDLEWLSSLSGANSLSSEQRGVLAEMRQGVQWTNSLVRARFAPMDSVEARRMMQHLVDSGFAVMTGDRGSASYSLAPSLAPGSRRATTAPTLFDDSSDLDDVPAEIAKISANARAVWAALDSPRSINELIDRVSLSERQVRYALSRMRAAGAVSMAGTQGDRATRYRRRERYRADRM